MWLTPRERQMLRQAKKDYKNSLNDKDDEVIRLAKYLRTDENLSNIKLVVLSEIPEYEIIRDEKDFGYTYYQKITEYSQENFVNTIMKI